MSTERLAEQLITFSRMLRPLQHAEMTPQQYWLLRHLRCSGSQTTGDLANALGITTGSATVACKRLEKGGLLTRERQAEDERVVLVTLTKQGSTLIDETRERRQEGLTHILAVLDEDEQGTLSSLIQRLVDAAEAQEFGVKKKHDRHH
ncbi:MarR family transcriptional regulator [Ktedonobacteria bacterium brp13]|nr:MarR family transcriptional regulator [Ktedonobacteria bacterium brp13]